MVAAGDTLDDDYFSSRGSGRLVGAVQATVRGDPMYLGALDRDLDHPRFCYHYWNYFPVNMVLPATMLPSALVLDVILMLTNSLTITAIAGGSAFTLLFYPSNWPIFAMYPQPLEYGGTQLTVADLFGFQYIRTGMPEYLRIIERGTLRTYGQMAAPLSAFASALLCTLMYAFWWHLGKWFTTVRYLKRI